MKQFDTASRFLSRNKTLNLKLTHLLLASVIAPIFAALSPSLATASEDSSASTYPDSPVAFASTDTMLLGGSSDILVVKPEDAKIVALTENAFLEIVLEPGVFQMFWDGVRDGTYEYLSINDCRFFVTYAPHSNSIYAYDWLGLQYLVSARPSN
jgi:hypothetical protein